MATLTVKEFAAKVDTDGRTARKFLRSITPKDDQPGKGARWAIEAKKVASLKKGFNTWNEARIAAAEDEVPEAPAALEGENFDEVPEIDDDI